MMRNHARFLSRPHISVALCRAWYAGFWSGIFLLAGGANIPFCRIAKGNNLYNYLRSPNLNADSLLSQDEQPVKQPKKS